MNSHIQAKPAQYENAIISKRQTGSPRNLCWWSSDVMFHFNTVKRCAHILWMIRRI